jgi:hypothetical protein
MDPPSFPKKTNTLLWLGDDKIIFASRSSCYVKNPFSSAAKFKLHDKLTHHIIANKDNTKVGLFCSNSFVVYDLSTRKSIWSLAIPYSDNYSATFSPYDDVIIYHKGMASFNYKQALNLPFNCPDESFDIMCNPKTKEIMYPSSNNTFSIKSFENNKIIRRSRAFSYENRNYRIVSAFYTPHNAYIMLHAYEKSEAGKSPVKEFFLLHNKIGTIINIPSPKNEINCSYYDVKILPHSFIAAALCNNRYIHFFDITQKKQILTDAIDNGKSYACKNNANIFDFNALAAYYTVITQKKSYLRKTPDCLLRYIYKQNICVPYLILCNYFQQFDLFVPKEIRALLVHYLHRLYTQNTIKENDSLN